MGRWAIIVLLFLETSAFSQVENDKVLHFVGGNLYGLAGAGIAKQISNGDRFWTFAGAIGGSALIGLGKEAIDSRKGGSGWDNDDLLATVLGGATVGITIDLFTDHKKRRRQQARGGLTTENSKMRSPMPLKSKLELPSMAQLSNPQLFAD